MNNKEGTKNKQTSVDYDEKYIVRKDEWIDEGTDVRRATYCEPDPLPACERTTMFGLRDPQDGCPVPLDSGPDVAIPLWRKLCAVMGY